MNSYELVYYQGELGLWVPDCECHNCQGMQFIPKRFGPITLQKHRQIAMIREIYDPILEKQLRVNQYIFGGTND